MRRAGERFVLVGLATARSTWLARVSQWVTSGSLPAELVRCLTIEEFRATLRTRTVSAALLDDTSRHADRDLLAAVRASGGAAVVVVGREPRRDWVALGADACLPEDFELAALAELLRTRALPVGQGDHADDRDVLLTRPPPAGHLVAVCGPGGTGASTVACGLAQGLAGPPGGGVVLADLALNGELGVLHGVPPGAGGLPGLVEAHRRGAVDPAGLGSFLVDVGERSYLLITGIRRRRAWTAMRPRALRSAVAALRSVFPWVVADTDSDAEGEPDSGSLDVEERNTMSRCALAQASAVVVVGQPGVKGVYALVRTIEDLVDFGVEPGRLVPVVNRCRSGRLGRAEIDGALDELAAPGLGHPPVFLPERDLERALVDAARLPGWLADPVTSAVNHVVARAGVTVAAADERRVQPGSLAYWGKSSEGALPA